MGTSGWSYPEWVGRFYPNGTSPARMLDFYARRFNAVEAHSSYRRLPTPAGVEQWCSQVPETFRFCPKAHLSITHRRDLEGVEDRVAAFVAAVAPLGERLGPLFFSLPHQQPDLDRLDRILAGLPAALPTGPATPALPTGPATPALPTGPATPAAAFELGPAWSIPEVIDRLERAGATLVQNDADRSRSQSLDIGPVLYLRLRRESYNRADLDAWAERLAKVRADGREAYVFLKHDDRADGPRYARRLLGRLGEP